MDRDEQPRSDSSLESLSKLKPAFRSGAPSLLVMLLGLNDGASAVLLMSAAKAKELNLKPLARVVASAAAGVDPRTMGLGSCRQHTRRCSAQI